MYLIRNIAVFANSVCCAAGHDMLGGTGQKGDRMITPWRM